MHLGSSCYADHAIAHAAFCIATYGNSVVQVSESPLLSDGQTMAAALVSGLSCDGIGTGELALPAGAGMKEPGSEPASRADAALLRPWKA